MNIEQVIARVRQSLGGLPWGEVLLLADELEKARTVLGDARGEIERLRAKVSETEDARLAAQMAPRIDVDSPLYEGLQLEFVRAEVLAQTVKRLKAERDEARDVAKQLFIMCYLPSERLVAIRKWPWLDGGE